jgi:hypothetical protein
LARRKSLPSIHCFPGPLLIFLGFTSSSSFGVTGSVYYAGVKIHQTRIIRLLEVLLHADNNLGGRSAKRIHQVILQSFQLSEKAYGLNQLRYDLRKLKGTTA